MIGRYLPNTSLWYNKKLCDSPSDTGYAPFMFGGFLSVFLEQL